MAVRLSPVSDQVIVVTGASSGIGLATALLAAASGASLVLVSRNGPELQRIADEITAAGGEAIAVVADVARLDDVERVAKRAEAAYGGIDSWVNNAGVSVYGALEQVPLADHRRVFDVNYWGVVHGSVVAARHLKDGAGGAIVNVGSVLSDRSVILQGPYSASKHAVKAFTDTLRTELERDGAPISVTLIKPSAIDTPFYEHARSYLDAPGLKNPPPAYDPALVARAILHACETPIRTLAVGFGGYAYGLFGAHLPRLTDALVERFGIGLQTRDEPPRPARHDNLYGPREDGAVSLFGPGGSRRTSLFLEAQLRPVATAMVLTALVSGIAGLLASRRRRSARAAAEEREPRRLLERRERLARGIVD